MGDGYIELPDWLRSGTPAPAPPVTPSVAPPAAPAATGAPAPPPATPPALVLPDGRRIPVTGPTLLGRDPQPRPGEPAATLVSTGADRSVSKTHALVEPAPGGVALTDRRSTNGTAVLDADGRRRALAPETPTAVARGERIALGEVVLRLE